MDATTLKARALAALGLAALLGLAGCASKPKDPLVELTAWTSDAAVSYRLISKDDFQAATSHKVWGNFAHAAEICTLILPEDDAETIGTFHAYMRPDCSFWNKVIGPLGRAGRVAAAAVGVLMFGGGKQPDWYVLQHEQVHFAISEIAARGLTRKLAEIPYERRTDDLISRVYEITNRHAQARNEKFDSETSGTYDPFLLEKWVRMLDREMKALCTDESQDCRVRMEYE